MPEHPPEQLPDLPPLREVIARHKLGARRTLGQNFLFDLNLTRRIARAAGPLAGRTVIEVGPGPGGLTRALLGAGADRVVVIERDSRCIAALTELADAFPGRLEVIEADALEVDATGLGDAPRKIVANLPFNVATPLLIGWLKRAQTFEGMTLMFQREVAERLAAKPESKAYGRLSVVAQWVAEVERLFNVDKRAFIPPPKVTATLITLTPRVRPLAPEGATTPPFATMERVTAAAFGQRRKMLRTALKSLGVDLGPLLATAGLDPRARAEEIDVLGFATLARALEDLSGGKCLLSK